MCAHKNVMHRTYGINPWGASFKKNGWYCCDCGARVEPNIIQRPSAADLDSHPETPTKHPGDGAAIGEHDD